MNIVERYYDEKETMTKIKDGIWEMRFQKNPAISIEYKERTYNLVKHKDEEHDVDYIEILINGRSIWTSYTYIFKTLDELEREIFTTIFVDTEVANVLKNNLKNN